MLCDYLIRQYDKDDLHEELEVVMVFNQIEVAEMIQRN